MKDHKTIAIIVLSIIVLVLGYICFGKDEPSEYDKKLLESKVKELHLVNTLLLKDISTEQKKTAKFAKLNDSLSNLKPQILIKYVQINKAIDNSSANGIINEFDNVFSEANIN